MDHPRAHLAAQAEVLNRTVDLNEVHGAITADIPVHVWLAGAVLSVRVDVENSMVHDANCTPTEDARGSRVLRRRRPHC